MKPETQPAARSSAHRMVRRFRVLRVGERVREGDQFYFVGDRMRWGKVNPDQLTYYGRKGAFGGVPEHYRGRFRRCTSNKALAGTDSTR